GVITGSHDECGGTYTETWTFTDDCNRTITATRDIVVEPAPAAVVICPGSVSFCLTENGLYEIEEIEAESECNANLEISFTITGATIRAGTGPNASGQFNEGISIIVWTVTDACGNEVTCETVVTINAVQVTIEKEDIGCFGRPVGTATAIATGGVEPYTYSWNTSPVQTTPTAINLREGVYTVIVTDANGCSGTEEVTITEPAAITFTTAITNVSCNGATDGSVVITPAGGTAPYTITP
ncbi:SprB repeat-containing protein, partial [Flavihumibacter sediminis]|nr:SprB repeat-containing protein [Flavihumibacter sediminis]